MRKQFRNAFVHRCTGRKPNGLNLNQHRANSIYFFAESTCLTTSGAAPNKPCIFPFIHEGVEYNECTSYEHGEHWCSTKVNETGKSLIINRDQF